MSPAEGMVFVSCRAIRTVTGVACCLEEAEGSLGERGCWMDKCIC